MNQFSYQNEQGDLANQTMHSEDSSLANFSSHEIKFWQHKFFWLFAVVVAAFLWLAGSYIYNNITKGVAYDVPDWLSNQLSDIDSGAVSVEELKSKDTDEDGLNNYQEIYQFHTSIFIQDTDSDGYSDYDESIAGEDPLCPRGQDCGLLKLITPTTKIGEVVRDVQLDGDLTLEQAALLQFREFLVEGGLTQEEVDQLTDEDLIAIFSAIDESQIVAEDLAADATPEQVKQFLLNQPGSNAEQINAMTDEQLMAIRDTLINIPN